MLPSGSHTDAKGNHTYPRHKVLSIMNRGITGNHSELKNNIEALIIHHKREPKFDCSLPPTEIMQLARMRECDHILYWETKHHNDLTLWMASSPAGPTIKFEVENLKTCKSFQFEGDFRRYTRPVLSFSAEFDNNSFIELRILKQMLKRIFGAPHLHHKSAPFVDHVIQFGVTDMQQLRVSFRVYSITPNPNSSGSSDFLLTEAGPRFTMTPYVIMSSVMCGDPLWHNAHYTTSTKRLSRQRAEEHAVQARKKASREAREQRDTAPIVDEIDAVFSRESYEAVFGPITSSDVGRKTYHRYGHSREEASGSEASEGYEEDSEEFEEDDAEASEQ